MEVPSTMDGVVTTVDVLQEASQWFPGGTKELRVSIHVHVDDSSLIYNF